MRPAAGGWWRDMRHTELRTNSGAAKSNGIDRGDFPPPEDGHRQRPGDRLDAIDKVIAAVDDTAGCASLAVEEIERRVRVWCEQIWTTVEDIADELLGDAPEDGDQPT